MCNQNAPPRVQTRAGSQLQPLALRCPPQRAQAALNPQQACIQASSLYGPRGVPGTSRGCPRGVPGTSGGAELGQTSLTAVSGNCSSTAAAGLGYQRVATGDLDEVLYAEVQGAQTEGVDPQAKCQALHQHVIGYALYWPAPLRSAKPGEANSLPFDQT